MAPYAEHGRRTLAVQLGCDLGRGQRGTWVFQKCELSRYWICYLLDCLIACLSTQVEIGTGQGDFDPGNDARGAARKESAMGGHGEVFQIRREERSKRDFYFIFKVAACPYECSFDR